MGFVLKNQATIGREPTRWLRPAIAASCGKTVMRPSGSVFRAARIWDASAHQSLSALVLLARSCQLFSGERLTTRSNS